MSKMCSRCGGKIPGWTIIDGVSRNLCSRKFCLVCSPFGKHNTRSVLIVDRSRDSKTGIPTRKCGRCGEDITADNGYKRERRGVVEFHSYCSSCFNIVTQIRWHKRKIFYIKQKGGKCVDCGAENLHPVKYDFHHMEKKDANFCDYKKWNKKRLENELKKCILLCCGCHRLRHCNHEMWKDAGYVV